MARILSSARTSLVLAAALGAALLSFPAVSLAQEGAIAGQVVDASNAQSLSGVQVFLPDHELGVLTGGDGTYRITGVPVGEVRVRARLIGYRQVTRTVQVSAGETTTLNFDLPVSAVSLQEVVVTATGQRERRELGNSFSSIDVAETVEEQSPTNFTNLLRGNSTGVTVQPSSGSVGTASTIKIRGNSSLGLSTTPIVYVDGARINNSNEVSANVGGQDISRLNDLNPEDIESIEVIKGPAAATLYGTEASSGVIRITTKQGLEQDTEYSFRAEQGFNYDDTDWWNMVWNTARGGLDFGLFFGTPAVKDTVYVQSLMEGTRFGEPFRDGHMQSYAAQIRGGAEGLTYFLSGEFQNDEGNLPNNGVDRYNGRANFNLGASEKVDISVSSGFTSGFTKLPENDNNLFSVVGNALGSPWWGPMTRSDPNTSGGEPVETCFLAFEISRNFGVPLSDASESCTPASPFFQSTFEDLFKIRNEEQVERFIGSSTVTWRPVDLLTGRFTVGYDQASTKLEKISPVLPSDPFSDESDLGLIQQTDNLARTLTLEGNTSLNLALTDDLRSQTTVGLQWFDEISEVSFQEGRRFPAGSPAVGNSVERDANDNFTETKTLGVFLQEQISWRDRLFVTPGVRFDDNSAFGEGLGIQEYFQANASYVVSEEGWFPAFFEQFRVRAAWGESGQQPGTNDALTILAAPPVRREGEDVASVRANQLGNEELQPETGEEVEIGFDASVLDGRLGLDFTYYDQTTENAIVQRQLAPSRGFPSPRFVNIGEIVNSGIEVALDAIAVQREDLTWSWRANLTTNDNEVTELPEPIILGAQRQQEGFPFASYFAPTVEIGPNDEVVVSDEEEFQGHPTPEWEGSLSTRISMFGAVTLFAQADYAAGHSLLNGTEDFNCGLFGGGGFFGSCVGIFKLNDDDGTLTDEARVKQRAARVGSEAPFVYDNNFLKLRTVSLRFDIPRSWVGLFGAQSASVQLSGEELMTWTAYQGLDPEVNFAGSDETIRQQFIGLPPGRRFNATLRFTF